MREKVPLSKRSKNRIFPDKRYNKASLGLDDFFFLFARRRLLQTECVELMMVAKHKPPVFLARLTVKSYPIMELASRRKSSIVSFILLSKSLSVFLGRVTAAARSMWCFSHQPAGAVWNTAEAPNKEKSNFSPLG